MENLFAAFETTSPEQWKARLEKDLKGVTFEQLSRTDANNFIIYPFYTREDLAAGSSALFRHTDWSIMQHIIVEDAGAANTLALAQLNDGVSGLAFQLSGPADLSVLLEGVELPYITVVFEAAADDTSFADRLRAYLDTAYPGQTDLNVYINTTSPDQQPVNRTLSINATGYNNRGANSVTELAAIACNLNEQLHRLSATGDLQATVRKVYISLATDTLFYEQLSKLRALRVIVHTLLQSYDITPDVYIHAVTSHIYRSHIDMHSNMLRDTLSAMAAVAGGADAVTVYPYDYAVRTPSGFSLRMAKNIQLLLREEAYLHHIADVSAGSYYIETLTRQLAEGAWTLFRELEQQGGWTAVQAGLDRLITEQADQLILSYKEGKKVLIGANKYKNNMETEIPSFRPGFPAPHHINIAQALS
ncbi:MAG: hypothetical protein BGO09_10420 [Bacteroidetes bacterium 47-18]|nr:MAG: hypothetical protein BGO09_10420 [Bacteroidetes bacterium 47-18]